MEQNSHMKIDGDKRERENERNKYETAFRIETVASDSGSNIKFKLLATDP